MNGDKQEVLQLEDGNLGSVPVDCQRPRQSTASRHLMVFGSIVGFLFFGMIAHRGFNFLREVSLLSIGLNEPGYPDPSDGTILRCIGGADWDTYYDLPSWAHQFPFGSESHFSLPVDSEAFYFVSRGAYQYGTVTLEQSAEASDNVIVRVRAAYNTDEAIDRANVCHLERQENEYAIGIFTPQSRFPGQDGTEQVRFDVTFILPVGTGEDVLYIKKLVTAAPLFAHEVAALSDTVLFGTISLNTANFPINSQSVAAETGTFTTVNGLIKGHFRSTSSLKLTTTNLAIDADVELFGGEGAEPSELIMTTMNAPLDARISLTTASGFGGAFRVDAQTVNAPLALTFIDSPVDSQLNSKARTMNAPATVHLHSAFEGSFSIGSSIIGPSLEQHRVDDPAGEGRRRLITASRSRGHIQGSVRWVGVEHSESRNGSVEVSTVLSPARVIL